MTSWPKPPPQRLTKREWAAIAEALGSRLAGPIDLDDADEPDAPRQEDYERAQRKVWQRTAR